MGFEGVGLEVGVSVVGFAVVGEFVGDVLFGSDGVGLEVGVSVVGLAEGDSSGTTTIALFISLQVSPTTVPYFIS